jgi:hypothetical protein
MDLHRGEWQIIEHINLGDHVVTTLTGKAEDKMASHRQAISGGSANGTLRAGKVVTAVDETQGPIVATLDAELHGDIGVACKLFEKFKDSVIYTVRPRADDKAHHLRVTQSLFVTLPKDIKSRISVAVGLEIG